MNNYRLQIDVSMDALDKEQAIKFSQIVMLILRGGINEIHGPGETPLKNIQYRLLSDNDRQPRNYLDLNDDGKAKTTKLKLFP